ncbi:amylo-alpha-1,6-glucosidase [Spongiivirga citrea]|uniref:Glycoside hydrolase n=1 Tax=Spongiivirga citrea TaxID=1481457 RepID=A0A6M0CFJ9_9FLAO|nr:trehalase family glycosidase [Spongiivirga citrea]NER16646.1 glycoside hydrolase [Spongiivirga citrea]
MKDQLLTEAQKVLNENFQKGGFTIPSKNLYPFQWKWDSGFIAIGYAHYDMNKAESEISTLLDAQWDNGFIPHIIFHTDTDTYFPGADFHKSELHPMSSKKYRSTGLVQPPVLGFVLEKIYHISKDKTRSLEFIGRQIDKVFHNHQYFYQNRDPLNEGLVYIYHNWESGTDNSPVWDGIFETMDSPEYEFERRDTSHVDPEQRPTKREYDHYLHIIEIAKQYNYDDQKIAQHSPFLVQDPLFNAMLIKSNESLIRLYTLLGSNDDKIEKLEKWQKKAVFQMNNKLFDNELNAYIYYDLRNKKPIRSISSSSFTPLFAGIPSKEDARKLIDTLISNFGGDDHYLCASFDPTSEHFKPKKYWRGPVWINLNWILFKGLKRYGFEDIANRVKADSIELITQNGFYEYFDCRKDVISSGNGAYGGNNFSWSAALIIDMLNQ